MKLGQDLLKLGHKANKPKLGLSWQMFGMFSMSPALKTIELCLTPKSTHMVSNTHNWQSSRYPGPFSKRSTHSPITFHFLQNTL